MKEKEYKGVNKSIVSNSSQHRFVCLRFWSFLNNCSFIQVNCDVVRAIPSNTLKMEFL